MDKLDMCLISFIYMFRTTFITISAFTSIVGREFKITLTWMSVSGINLIIIML